MTIHRSIGVDPETHRRLRLLAAIRGVTIIEVIRELVEPLWRDSRVRWPNIIEDASQNGSRDCVTPRNGGA